MFLARCAAALPGPWRANPVAGAPAVLDLAALLGEAAWARLPPAVRRRFAAGHPPVVYEGRMNLHCSALGRVLAVLLRPLGGPLTAARAQGVPTRVRVQGDGRGGMVWQRQFAAAPGCRAAVVQSTKLLGRDGGLVERTAGGLAMRLVVFEEGGALVFESRRYFLDVFGLALPLPAWCCPGTCRVEHHDEGPGRFRFELRMHHPWWGETFRQWGRFIDPDAGV